jgi:hypothetical protein
MIHTRVPIGRYQLLVRYLTTIRLKQTRFNVISYPLRYKYVNHYLTTFRLEQTLFNVISYLLNYKYVNQTTHYHRERLEWRNKESIFCHSSIGGLNRFNLVG